MLDFLAVGQTLAVWSCQQI